MYRYLVCLILWLSQSVSATENDGELVQFDQKNPVFFAVVDRLKSHDQISGAFTQHKHLRILRRPLRSSGHFHYSESSGVKWLIESPIQLQLQLSDTQLVEVDSSGHQSVKQIKDHPEIQGFSAVFKALISGDVESVQSEFLFYFSGTIEKWQIVMTPQVGLLQKAFKSITLSGQQSISQILLLEVSGDKTVLEFSDIITQARNERSDVEQ